MSYDSPQVESPESLNTPVSHRDYRVVINVVLFLLTIFTTMVAGVEWRSKDPFELSNLGLGIAYSLAIIFVLATHEFGHYFAARYHSVDVTLPYFMPFPPTPFFLNFGTLGALIKTRSAVQSRKALFDIGVAGPLAGFVACIVVLILGFLTLPGPEYILALHPHYDFTTNNLNETTGIPLEFGNTITYSVLSSIFTDPSRQFVPPMSEIYHYPLLCVGWFGLFVTAMNLIPIGQFDGGHIIYTILGPKHRIVSRYCFAFLLVLGFPSVLDTLIRSFGSLLVNDPIGQVIPFAQYSWSGWFIWALVSLYVVKLDHPPVPDDTPLDHRRQMIGWIAFAVLVCCFTFSPFTIPI